MAGQPWSLEDKIRAAFAYIITGNSQEASAICGIPDRTIREWSEHTWWSDLINEAKITKNAELDALYTRIIDKAVRGVEDRVTNGDESVTKDGGTVRKAVSGRDLAIIAATFQDKRAIIRGEPTSISKRISERDRLQEIAAGLESVAEGISEKKAEIVH